MTSATLVRGTEGDAKFQVEYRTLAIAFGLLALGFLGALLAVVYTNKADTLAVVALVVSIVSFLIQIAIALAQLAQSNAQLAQAERLNTESLKTMTAIESGLGETRRAVQTQTDALISLAAGKLSAVSLKRDLVEEGDQTDLLRRVDADELLSWLVEASRSGLQPAKSAQVHRAQMVSDTAKMLARLESLDDEALALFTLAVIDGEQSARLGGVAGLPRGKGDDPLMAAALATTIDVAGVELVTLSDEGRIAAGALTLPLVAFASDRSLQQRVADLRDRLDPKLREGLESEADRGSDWKASG